MGRVRTKVSDWRLWNDFDFLMWILYRWRFRHQTVKKSAKIVIERYYPRLTLDFETNKRLCDEIAIIASKRLRNKVSKYIYLCLSILELCAKCYLL